jgi:glutathione synthase/RimK-type ligase-like ATP-grasp enzyme
MEALGIKWLTAPHVLAWAELKLVQLERARRLGVPFPDTLVTNDRERALAFAEGHPKVVVKPIRYGLVAAEEQPLVAWTSEPTRQDLEQLDGPPVILQAFVDAREHVRAVTVGARVFLSTLQTEALDWRSVTANHDRFRAVRAGEYPLVSQGALALADALGLGFSAQDWIIGRDDAPYFIEANPNGQWAFLEPAHGGAIGRALVAELEERADGACTRPEAMRGSSRQ